MKVGLRGAIGLSDYTGGGFFQFIAKCIRFFTKSQWSHTFAVTMEDAFLGPIVEEAGPVGVVNAGIDKYIDGPFYLKLWMPKTTEADVNRGIQRIFPMLNKSYGYFMLLGFILVWLWYKTTLRKANNPFRGGIICSELVLEYLKAVFPEEQALQKMDRDTTSPEDVYEFILNHPDLFEEIPIPNPGN